jgi:diguanylate cyclase
MKKILVIEDEDSIREDILEILCGGAFEAIGAENGMVGVKLAKLHKPDLIICDVMMPELDGHSVLRALRSETSTAMIPFIFLTAKADKTDIRRGMNLGADDYLSKPIGQADLLEAIATRLNKQSVVELHLQNSLKETQDRLDFVVYHDSLTNLPNRLSLRARLDEILEQADREQRLIPILLIDIDRFKRVNDVKGHKFGDALLKALAERLLESVADDVVARMDADEFAIILNATDPKGEADYMAQTILNELMRAFTIDDQEVYITASIGISLYPQDGRDIDTLFKHVNLAMYRAKKLGGNCYEFYTTALNESNPSQLALESNLHHALEKHEFQVYYQPQIDLRTGIIVGAEALVRWYHPQMGILSPDKFIPLAEENGAIVSIGEWILVTACQQAKVWHEIIVGAGGDCRNNHLKVAVNLSGRQFQQPNLATKIVRLIEETELDPSCLELELTEGVIIRDVEASITKMNDLKAIGVQISIDDFGTGYSSLSYLKQFPFDTLKIDQCFIRNMTNDPKNQAIAIAIIQMAHSLDLKVIAEGVETKAEVEMLCQHHCDEIQGYIFSRPVPAEEFTRLLASDRRLPI